MKITLELLRLWGVCDSGYRWFAENYREGGELTAVVRKLLIEGRGEWASWTMKKAGALMAAAPELLKLAYQVESDAWSFVLKRDAAIAIAGATWNEHES